jgi:hypothetical protein
MKIGLIDVDSHNFPNLALMKISSFHKEKKDEVNWHNPLHTDYDVVYMSKVFTFSQDYKEPIFSKRIEKGGTGYDLKSFWNGQKFITLLDPNLLACKEHMELLKQLGDSKAYIDFTQGLDARLLLTRQYI